MIHVAVAFLVVSMTLAALTVLTFVLPDVEDASPVRWTGAIAAVTASGALLYFVRRWRV